MSDVADLPDLSDRKLEVDRVALVGNKWMSVQNRTAPFGPILVLAGPEGSTVRGAAVILRRGEEILLVRESRYGVMRSIAQLPGGGVDSGEDDAAAGLRELREETGYSANGEVTHLGVMYPMAPYVDAETAMLFVRDDDVVEAGPSDSEIEGLMWVDIDSAFTAAVDGTLRCAVSVTAILRAHAYGLLD